MSKIADLLPCPFCGGTADFSETNAWWVRCNECNAETEAAMSPEGAAEYWNRRTPPPPSHVAVTEAAKRYLEAIDSDPENDIWDTWDGKPAEGALKTASDASWADHGQKIEARLSELRAALATTEGSTDV